jgi:6-phosphogluconolactonase/glucosamine-6-phosphate isomerase/deaminase
MARMLEGTITTELPASFLQLHPDVTVMLDRAASPR